MSQSPGHYYPTKTAVRGNVWDILLTAGSLFGSLTGSWVRYRAALYDLT
jgi:hypothetical protein